MADICDRDEDYGPALDCDAVLRTIPHLRRLANAFTPDLDAADDVVEIVLRCAIDQQTPRPNGTQSRVWLFTLLHNVLADQMRIRLRFAYADDVSSVDSDDLDAAVRELPFDQRVALLLVVFEDFSYSEVAEITGVGVRVVKSRLFQARENLRRTSSRMTEGREIETATQDDRVGGIECFP